MIAGRGQSLWHLFIEPAKNMRQRTIYLQDQIRCTYPGGQSTSRTPSALPGTGMRWPTAS